MLPISTTPSWVNRLAGFVATIAPIATVLYGAHTAGVLA